MISQTEFLRLPDILLRVPASLELNKKAQRIRPDIKVSCSQEGLLECFFSTPNSQYQNMSYKLCCSYQPACHTAALFSWKKKKKSYLQGIIMIEMVLSEAIFNTFVALSF